MTAIKGDGGGYVAIDDFEFLHSAEDNEFCKIKPDSATPTTSTVPPTSTGINKHFPILFLWCQFQNYLSNIYLNIGCCCIKLVGKFQVFFLPYSIGSDLTLIV